MLGTQDQNVSVTFWFEDAEEEDAGEPLEEQPATSTVAARAQAAALAGRGNFIVHSCRGGVRGTAPGWDVRRNTGLTARRLL
jgi:hypothetical protein